MSDPVERMLSRLDQPMFVVTTVDPVSGERSGCLVGFLTQCSIDPVRFLVCVSKTNHTIRIAQQAELLAVHVLAERQHDLAELFGGTTGDEIDKFQRCAWRPGPGGLPLLTTPPAWFAGGILDRFDLGDHAGFLISPTAGEIADDELCPLMLSAVRDLTPGHPA